MSNPFVVQAAAFLAALDGNNACRNQPADTIDDIRIAEAIVASARQGQTIPL